MLCPCLQAQAVSSEALNSTIASLTAQIQQLQTAVVALSVKPEHTKVSSAAPAPVVHHQHDLFVTLASSLPAVRRKPLMMTTGHKNIHCNFSSDFVSHAHVYVTVKQTS